jgi:hypothetical protein
MLRDKFFNYIGFFVFYVPSVLCTWISHFVPSYEIQMMREQLLKT